MARPGKEQLFFFASAGLCGLLGTFVLLAEVAPRRAPAGKKPDVSALAKKEIGQAPRGALKDRGWVGDGREAFLEPRDWLPLPPANLERPPLRDPAYVPPLPPLSVGLDRVGVYRRPSVVTPHAFAEEAPAAPVEPTDDAPANAASATSGNGAAKKGAAAPTPAVSGNPPPPAADDLDFKRKFDWLEVAGDSRPWYGAIQNKDKFGLLSRLEEAVQFSRLDPKSGRIMQSGSIDRTRVKEGGVHFADTPLNRSELLLRQVPEAQWTQNGVPRVLDVAAQLLPLGREDRAVLKRAADVLEKCVSLDPKNPRVYELLADADAAAIAFEDELSALERAESAGVESPGLVVRRSRWLLRVGARAGALARLAEGVARWPTDRSLRLAYGRALLDEGSSESDALALDQFTQAEQQSETGEQRSEVIAEIGAARLGGGDLDRAQQAAKRILDVDKAAPRGLALRGSALLAAGKFDQASADFEALLAGSDAQGVEAGALLSLALVRTRNGAVDAAKADLDRVATIDPLLAAAGAAAQADLLEVTGHAEAAVARCRDAVARAPDDSHVRYFLGRLLRRSGDLEGARTELRRALDLGATFPDLFSELGFLALEEGRAADARRYFEESLAREERDETKLLLAHAHMLGGELQPARALLEVLQAKQPTSEVLLALAWCSYKRGESAAAQQLWQQVKDDLPNAPAEDKAYAAKWLAQVQDLESKQSWEDTIPWREVGNGWDFTGSYDLEARIQPGDFRIFGVQRAGTQVDQWTYLKRDIDPSNFFEYEVVLSTGKEHAGRTGFGLVQFTGSGSGNQAVQVRASLLLALEPDGTLLLQRREHVEDAAWSKIGKVALTPDEPIRFTLRRKERGAAAFQFFADDAPVGEPIEMQAWRGKTRTQIAALFFAAAPGNKKCDASLHSARRIEFLPN